MSSPAQAGPSVPKEKEKRLSKMLARVKTVLKKADPQRRPTKPGPSSAAPPAGDAPISVASMPPGKGDDPPTAGVTRVLRSQLYEERAKKLGERYGLEIKPSEWYSAEGHALRVEKPIRMRVHRECHRCGHTFGLAKECPSCKHIRCKECQRRPPKRTEAEKEESRKRRAALLKKRAEDQPIIADWDTSEKKVELTRPAKHEAQDRVYKKKTQRVRRTCCQCEKLFVGRNTTCAGCQHIRCTDCPREPASKKKYPYGYPGDQPGAKSVPRYECHECKAPFPPTTEAEVACPKCSHKKCDSCQRLKPRKVQPEPDPEAWKTVQAKLAELKLK